MKRALILLFIVTAILAHAEVLVVTKSGEAIRATTAKKTGDSVVYMSLMSGEEKTVPVASLDGVISKVRRGKQYKTEYIEKNIGKIKKVMVKHKKLYRQLNSMLQEWETLLKPVEGLEEDIAKWVDGFGSSKKDTAAYKAAVVGLGMATYKDLQGKYKEKIDGHLEEMRVEYMAINTALLKEMQAKARITIKDFIWVKDVSSALLRAGKKDEEKDSVKTILGATRKKVFTDLSSYARGKFLKSKSVDSFLESARIYYGILEEVVDNDADKQKAAGELKTLIGLISKSSSGYNFKFIGPPLDEDGTRFDYTGYPLKSDECDYISGNRYAVSYSKSQYIEMHEECIVIPQSVPANLSLRGNYSVPVTIVLKSAQPSGREFAWKVRLSSENGEHVHYTPITALKAANGHAKLVYKESFTSLNSGFQLGYNRQGKSYLRLSLAYSTGVDRNGAKQWLAISPECTWRIRP